MKDPLNNMDPNALRVVHIGHTPDSYACGRLRHMVMWGAKDIAENKLPTCLPCIARTPVWPW